VANKRTPLQVTVVGAGRLGSTLCRWLAQQGRGPAAVVDLNWERARRAIRSAPGAQAWHWPVWLGAVHAAAPGWLALAIPDDAIEDAAAQLAAARADWRGWCIWHTSGARSAAVLRRLRRRGAAVGSLHPMMTFPRSSSRRKVEPAGVIFSLEGDPLAKRAARSLVRAWGGVVLELTPRQKTAFHLAATLVGPGAVVAMAEAEAVLRRAGLGKREITLARTGLRHLLQATAGNLEQGLEAAWTGPWARGDVTTLTLHRRLLGAGIGRGLYDALDQAAAALLPRRLPAKLISAHKQ